MEVYLSFVLILRKERKSYALLSTHPPIKRSFIK